MHFLNICTIDTLLMQIVQFDIALLLYCLRQQRAVRYDARLNTHCLHDCDPCIVISAKTTRSYAYFLRPNVRRRRSSRSNMLSISSHDRSSQYWGDILMNCVGKLLKSVFSELRVPVSTGRTNVLGVSHCASWSMGGLPFQGTASLRPSQRSVPRYIGSTTDNAS